MTRKNHRSKRRHDDVLLRGVVRILQWQTFSHPHTHLEYPILRDRIHFRIKQFSNGGKSLGITESRSCLHTFSQQSRRQLLGIDAMGASIKLPTTVEFELIPCVEGVAVNQTAINDR
jgi:hypothetical protein